MSHTHATLTRPDDSYQAKSRTATLHHEDAKLIDETRKGNGIVSPRRDSTPPLVQSRRLLRAVCPFGMVLIRWSPSGEEGRWSNTLSNWQSPRCAHSLLQCTSRADVLYQILCRKQHLPPIAILMSSKHEKSSKCDLPARVLQALALT